MIIKFSHKNVGFMTANDDVVVIRVLQEIFTSAIFRFGVNPAPFQLSITIDFK